MFGTNAKGLAEPCYVILLLVLGLGGGYVNGRPQGDPKVQVRGQSETSGSSLRFSPELLLENTLESAASPASIYPHFPPSAIARNNPPPTAKGQTKTGRAHSNKGNSLDNTNDISFVNSNQDRPADPEHVKIHAGSDVNNVNAVNSNKAQGWPNGAPRDVSSNTGVNSNGLQPNQRYDGLHDSYRTGTVPSSGVQSQPRPAQDPAVTNPKDNTDDILSRPQSPGYSPSREPTVKGDPGLPQTRQQNSPYRSVYPAVNGSPEMHEDVDVDGLHGAGLPPSSSEEDLGLSPLLRERPLPPQPFQPSSYKAGDAPASSSLESIAGQQVVSSDVDVDRPVNQQPAQGPIPGNQEDLYPPSLDKGELDDETFAIEVEVDLDSEENPFRDEDEGAGEVPLELALQVIQAMKAEPAWKQYIGSGWEEMEPYWEDEDDYDDEDEDDYYYEDEESDEYDDWIPAGNLSPQNSRLITLIIETIGVTDKEPEDSQDSDMDIWQILNNFPFHMLLGKQNVDEDDYYSDEYDEEYDEDEYDEDEYDEDEYDEDDYDEDDYDTGDEYDEYYDDEDSYDDDDYDDIYDEDDEENQKYAVSREEDRANFLRLRKETDSDSDEVFDDEDDCDDGACRNDVNNNVRKKDDFTVFSVVPPMVTKKRK